jgi:hypothetical protein
LIYPAILGATERAELAAEVLKREQARLVAEFEAIDGTACAASEASSSTGCPRSTA